MKTPKAWKLKDKSHSEAVKSLLNIYDDSALELPVRYTWAIDTLKKYNVLELFYEPVYPLEFIKLNIGHPMISADVRKDGVCMGTLYIPIDPLRCLYDDLRKCREVNSYRVELVSNGYFISIGHVKYLSLDDLKAIFEAHAKL